jgi:hypothetical protein
LRAGVNVSLHLVNPQPGCGLGEEFGTRSQPIAGIPPDMAFGAGETEPERALIAAHPDLFSTWSLLPQDEAHLRDLHAIATELPEVLMRYPRTFALLRSRRACDALDLYRAWRAARKSFEAFARAERDPVIDEALRWEQALVRQGSASAVASTGGSTRGAPPIGPRACGETLLLEHDLPAICAALRTRAIGLADSGSLASARKATTLCVIPARRGVETLRVSRDVARLLAELDGHESLPALEARLPGIASVITRLADAGLVELPVSSGGGQTAEDHSLTSTTKEKLRA